MTTINPDHITKVVELVGSLERDGNTQLTILARAFVLGCKMVGGVEKETALRLIGQFLDEPVTFKPLQ